MGGEQFGRAIYGAADFESNVESNRNQTRGMPLPQIAFGEHALVLVSRTNALGEHSVVCGGGGRVGGWVGGVASWRPEAGQS